MEPETNIADTQDRQTWEISDEELDGRRSEAFATALTATLCKCKGGPTEA